MQVWLEPKNDILFPVIDHFSGGARSFEALMRRVFDDEEADVDPAYVVEKIQWIILAQEPSPKEDVAPEYARNLARIFIRFVLHHTGLVAGALIHFQSDFQLLNLPPLDEFITAFMQIAKDKMREVWNPFPYLCFISESYFQPMKPHRSTGPASQVCFHSLSTGRIII